MTFDPKVYHNRILLEGLAEYATQEVPGPGNNMRIIQYHGVTSLKATADSVPWCSSYCLWVAKRAGLKTAPANAWAESWLGWGAKANWPIPGAIVVFKNHVGFVVKATPTIIYTLVGNQSDAVNIKAYPIGTVLGYRVARAEDVATPAPAAVLAAVDETPGPSFEGEIA
jgi:uncharacterized protein (TIGR02594 family)